MKTIKLLISIFLVAAVVVVFESCKGGDDPGPGGAGGETNEISRVTTLLTSATWKLNSITVDGVAKNMYSGMTLTFKAPDSYTSTKADPVWTATGTWSFSDATAKTIVRNDLLTVNIESINESNLTLSLTWSKNTLGQGRVESISGKNVFVFGK